MTTKNRNLLTKWGIGLWAGLITTSVGIILNVTIKSYYGWSEFRNDTEADRKLQAEKWHEQQATNDGFRQSLVQVNERVSKKADQTQVDFIQEEVFRIK